MKGSSDNENISSGSSTNSSRALPITYVDIQEDSDLMIVNMSDMDDSSNDKMKEEKDDEEEYKGEKGKGKGKGKKKGGQAN